MKINLEHIDTILDHNNEFLFLATFFETLTEDWQDYLVIVDKLQKRFPEQSRESIIFLIGYCAKYGREEAICEIKIEPVDQQLTYYYRRRQPECVKLQKPL